VHSVLLGRDFPATFGTVVPAVSYEGRGGSRVIAPERPLLAGERVRFSGEEIALVLAESPALALDAAERIALEYEEGRAAIGLDGALRAGAPNVHDAVPGNICFDFDYGDEGCAHHTGASPSPGIRRKSAHLGCSDGAAFGPRLV
jgi:carbon-monoxide dehydrogenase large subunit